MFTRNREQAETVEWGGGTSDRLLVEKDNMGFAVCHTIVKQGTASKLEYRNHLEACYCISGSGS
ncbi:ectoine synthase, partial [Micrococcus lylae]